MTKFTLKAGAEIDMLSQAELDRSLRNYFANREIARLRGIKHMRLPEVLTGKASGNAISLGVDKGQPPVGPLQGYIWSISRLVVTGLTAGASPDVVNLYKTSATGPILWAFDGNHFGYTFGKLQVTLYGGETLALASSGTFNSTSQVILSGELIEVPAELIGKLA